MRISSFGIGLPGEGWFRDYLQGHGEIQKERGFRAT